MAKMLTKSILLPVALVDALARGAKEKRVSFGELVRQMLSEQFNSHEMEARLSARLERQEKILLSIIAALNEDAEDAGGKE